MITKIIKHYSYKTCTKQVIARKHSIIGMRADNYGDNGDNVFSIRYTNRCLSSLSILYSLDEAVKSSYILYVKKI